MSTWDDYKKTMVEPPTLFGAAKQNDVPLLERLLCEGAAIDERDHRGYSALMLATYTGNAEAFAFLLGRGADVNSVDFAGNSILMGAAFKGHGAMVDALVARGADLRLKNHAGLDAVGFATTFGRIEIADRLRALLGDGDRNEDATGGSHVAPSHL